MNGNLQRGRGDGRVHITKRAEVATSHRLAHPAWDDARNQAVYGLEARPHGHNLLVEATVSGPVDPRTGMVLNIKDVKRALTDMLARYDHQDLNGDHPAFAATAPTLERVAETMWAELAPAIPEGRLERLRLFENDDARYEITRAGSPPRRPQGGTMLITRRYTFSAAHRLHSPHLSDTDNARLFQGCNNPNGHGHNYTLEVTVAGGVDPQTGLAADHAALDKAVREAVVDRYHYRNLNDDLPEFAGQVTTSENIVRIVWDLLAKKLGTGTLHRVMLGETRDNYFEYYG
ncbi:MAG: 6-carboxytetrahydropterin synthase [Nitrospirae bacterium]|nr:6-carboxytetrahydropterin synthase [Nitrospirota bacterium]